MSELLNEFKDARRELETSLGYLLKRGVESLRAAMEGCCGARDESVRTLLPRACWLQRPGPVESELAGERS